MGLLKQLLYLSLFAFLGQLVHDLSFILPLDSASKAIEREIEPLNNLLTSITIHHARSIDVPTNIRGLQPHVDENENPTCKQLLTSLVDKATAVAQAESRVFDLGRDVVIHGKSLANNTMSFANDWVELDGDARKARAAELEQQSSVYLGAVHGFWCGLKWLLTSTTLMLDEFAMAHECCGSIRGYLEQLRLQSLSAISEGQSHGVVGNRQPCGGLSRLLRDMLGEQEDVIAVPQAMLM